MVAAFTTGPIQPNSARPDFFGASIPRKFADFHGTFYVRHVRCLSIIAYSVSSVSTPSQLLSSPDGEIVLHPLQAVLHDVFDAVLVRDVHQRLPLAGSSRIGRRFFVADKSRIQHGWSPFFCEHLTKATKATKVSRNQV